MPVSFETLKARPDFLRAARGKKAVRLTLVLQCRDRREPVAGAPRFGFTATRKLGGAVVRNRTKRRLREAVRLADPACTAPGHDYVLIGRSATATVPFARIRADLESALKDCRRRRRNDGATPDARQTEGANGRTRRTP